MTFLKAAPLAFALALGAIQVVPVGRASLPTGCSNGQSATYNTTTRVWDCATGGGSATTTSAYASPPGSPASGDLWFPSDSFYVNRYSGSAWVPWGPIFPMTPPVGGDFSWVNQLTATVTTTNGGTHLLKPGASGYNLVMRIKTAPATPYTITAGFISHMAAVDFVHAGLVFRQSSDGKLQTFANVMNPTGSFLLIQKWTNPTTFDSGQLTLAYPQLAVSWLRIADNGTNRVYSWSTDGQNWQVLYTVVRTDHLTADQVGFFVNANNATYSSAMTLLSWKEGS